MGWRDKVIPSSETSYERSTREMSMPSPHPEWSKKVRKSVGGIDLGRTIMQGFWGANEAIQGALNVPADVIEQVGGVPMPKFRLETGQSFPNSAPQDAAQRIARQAGNVVGQVIPAAAIPYMAPSVMPAIPGAVGRGLETYVQGVKNAPIRAAAGELVAGLGSGLGEGISQEIAPGSQAAAMAGAIIGGITPAAIGGGGKAAMWSPTAYVTRKAAQVVRSYKEPPFPDLSKPGPPLTPMQQRTAQTVQDEIGGLSPKEKANLGRAVELREKIPGFDPTLAESTGAPSLLRAQSKIESMSKGTELEDLYRRRERSDLSIAAYGKKVAPGVDLGPQYIVDEASGKLKELTGAVGQERTRTEALRQEIAGEVLLRRGSPSDVGAGIRKRIIKERTKAAGEIKQIAQKYGVDEIDLTVEFDKMAEKVAADIEGTGGRFGAKRKPEIYRELRSRMKGEDGDGSAEFDEVMGEALPGYTPEAAEKKTITFSDIQSLSTRINDELRTAKRATDEGASSRARSLAIMKIRLDEMVDELGEGTGAVENWRAFRQEYRAFKDKYDRGTVMKVRRKDFTGAYITTDENVARSFINPRDKASIKQYVSIFGKKPKAMDALASAFVDDFSNAAIKDGVIDPQKAAMWTKKHMDILNEVPQIKSMFLDAAERNKSYAERQAHLAARQAEIEDTILAKEISAFSKTEDPVRTMDGIIRNPAAFRQLNRTLSDEGKAATKRYVWDYVRRNGPDSLSPDLMKEALGAEHYNNIRDIFDAINISQRMPYPSGVALEPRVLSGLEDFMGMKIPQALTRGWALHSRRVPVYYTVSEAAVRFFRGRSMAQQEALMKEALYNPGIAKALSELVFAKGSKPPSAKRLNTWLATVGLSEPETGSEEEGR